MSIFARQHRATRRLLQTKCVLLCLCSSRARATPADTHQRDIGLGVVAGVTSGIGLNLRADLGQAWGASFSAFAYPAPKRMLWSTGAQLSRRIWSKGVLRSYALVGANYLGANTYFPEPFAGRRVRRRFQVLAFGAGLGIEARVGPFGYIFELPLTGIAALTPDTNLRFPGRLNFGVFPNFALCLYFGSWKQHHAKKPSPKYAHQAR